MNDERYWICEGPGKMHVARTAESAETARKFGFEVTGPLMPVPRETQIKAAADAIENRVDELEWMDGVTTTYELAQAEIRTLLGLDKPDETG